MKAVTHNKIVKKCAAPASEKLLKKEEFNREIEWESKAGYVTLGSSDFEWLFLNSFLGICAGHSVMLFSLFRALVLGFHVFLKM